MISEIDGEYVPHQRIKAIANLPEKARGVYNKAIELSEKTKKEANGIRTFVRQKVRGE